MYFKQSISILPLMAFLLIFPVNSIAQEQQTNQAETPQKIIFNGFFSREENDGKMARLSGKSHYMKFFSPNRIVRLFIPYPYSTTVSPESISKVFDQISDITVGDAFIRGKFDVMEQEVIANLGTVKVGGNVILFDCDSSSPCRIEFKEKSLRVIKKGILADHIIEYEHINK